MFEAMLEAKRDMTPKSGVNLCQIDAFDFPPDNIAFVAHFPTMEVAKAAVAKLEKLELDKYVLIDSEGNGMTVDDGKGGPAPQAPPPSKEDGETNKMTIAEIFKAASGAPATGAPPAAGAAPDSVLSNSYESLLKAIKGPVCAGSGCANKAPVGDDGEPDYTPHPVNGVPHRQEVKATFPDHAYVGCHDEGRMWKVPYMVGDAGSVYTGMPEEHVSVYKPFGATKDGDDVHQGGGLKA